MALELLAQVYDLLLYHGTHCGWEILSLIEDTDVLVNVVKSMESEDKLENIPRVSIHSPLLCSQVLDEHREADQVSVMTSQILDIENLGIIPSVDGIGFCQSGGKSESCSLEQDVALEMHDLQ